MSARMIPAALVAAALLMPLVGRAVPVAETVSAATDQTEVAVTIYNDDLALVRDARRVRLGRELNRLAWREVSAQLRPETAQLRNTVSVAVREPMPGDWSMVSESQPHAKAAANTAEWQVKLPAGQATLAYRVRVRY